MGEDVNEFMANNFYQRIQGEIAKCESNISMANPERFGHHHDIVYENKVRLSALRTVLQDVVEDVEQEFDEEIKGG